MITFDFIAFILRYNWSIEFNWRHKAKYVKRKKSSSQAYFINDIKVCIVICFITYLQSCQLSLLLQKVQQYGIYASYLERERERFITWPEMQIFVFVIILELIYFFSEIKSIIFCVCTIRVMNNNFIAKKWPSSYYECCIIIVIFKHLLKCLVISTCVNLILFL